MGEMKKKRLPRARFFFISPIYFLAPATQATITWFNEGFAEYMDTYTVDSLLTDTSIRRTPP